MTKTAKRARSVICTLLAFILSLSVTLTLACATLALSALNPDFAVRVVARSQYSEHLAAELKEEFISYGNACNIDEVFFDAVFQNEIAPARIDADTETVLREFYAGEVQDAVDIADLHDALLNRLTEYAIGKGFAVEPSDDTKSIKTFRPLQTSFAASTTPMFRYFRCPFSKPPRECLQPIARTLGTAWAQARYYSPSPPCFCGCIIKRKRTICGSLFTDFPPLP